MSTSKLISLSEAIGRFVPDGSSVAAGLGLEASIPFAAGHEIMRQRKRGLGLIGPISDMLFDQMIGAGCVHRVQAAWVGNVITGSGYNFRRAVESGALRVEDHSNLTIAMALKAAAMGVSFMPVRTALGSGLFVAHPGLKPIACPFTGTPLAAVAAIAPDVALIHVQRADESGSAHVWGNLGVMRDACLAARHVVITAEEIVPAAVIVSDPNRVIIPGFRVSAVCHVPWGAHPAPVAGCYNRDHRAFIEYRNASRTPEAFVRWQERWVDTPKSRDDYLRLLGAERMSELVLRNHLFPAPVDYGY
ncbi:MAG: CoA transferase subunit A [Deltaproteobacteria bacterium]|nr:CoA transferase subunit A [Deltaproteobacteria bacterium]